MNKLVYALLGKMLVLLCVLCFSSESLAQPVFDSNRAYQYLKKQCAFGPRPPSSTAHEKTKNYFISELKKYARSVTPQNFSQSTSTGMLKLTNIIAIFGPEVDKKILLAAHWDTRPFADKDTKPNKRNMPIIGANDGASGVAVLLELARIFYEKPPPVKIIMVLFDGEDYGKNTNEMFLGSKYFAKNIAQQWIPEYGILLDMIGDKELNIYIEQNSIAAAPEIVKKVWNTANQLGLKQFHNEVRYGIEDDHIPLINIGISCIDIIDFDYPYWHTTQDTPDKCSPESLGVIGRLLVELIYH
jgi:glutaminyl-peptide cyclotransferase